MTDDALKSPRPETASEENAPVTARPGAPEDATIDEESDQKQLEPSGAIKAEAEGKETVSSATAPAGDKPAADEKAADVEGANGDEKKDGSATVASANTPAGRAKTKSMPKSASRRKSLANLKGKGAPGKEKEPKKYEPGQYVMAKMRSYPPWPAIVLNQELLPEVLLKPGGTGRVKNKSLESVGSAAWHTQYPIMFMGTHEYSWLPVENLDELAEERIKSGSGGKKTKGLPEAYQEALDGFSLGTVKKMQELSMEVDKEPEEGVEPDEDDEMDVDEEEVDSEDEKPKKKAQRGKKRKKSDSTSEDEAESDKPAKTPKKAVSKTKTPRSATKAKTPKTPKTPANGVKVTTSKPKSSIAKEKATPAKGKKTATPATKGKKGAKNKETPESGSEGSEKASAQPESPGTVARNAMLHRRHRLQKAFLNKDKTPPSEGDMPELSKFLGNLETWENLTVDLIKATKIHKVLKGIMKVDFEIPLEDKFHFKKRSEDLYKQWMEMIAAEEKKAALAEKRSKEAAAAEQGGEGPKENGVTMNGNAGELKNETAATITKATGKAEGDQEEPVTAVTAAGEVEA